MSDETEYFQWWLPPEPRHGPKGKPRLSRWKMDRETAAARGLTEPYLPSREVRSNNVGGTDGHARLGTSWKLGLPDEST